MSYFGEFLWPVETVDPKDLADCNLKHIDNC